MLKCGLLGEKLGHSYSPEIHSMLGDYSYSLFEKSADELGEFLKNGIYDGLNVTIPYKKAVIPYCDELSVLAREIGSVNTIVRRADGSLFGDNTDAMGFEALIIHSGIAVSGKKALVLGTGGASVTVCAVLKKLGAREVITVSRSGENNYGNISRHFDADIIVNATPVGMYPDNGASPLELAPFKNCSGVLDLIYNPTRTALLIEAEALGIPCAGGLYMLVAQAKKSSELFTGKEIPDSEIERIEKILRRKMQNIVLIGMPGCGKSTLAEALGKRLGCEVFDSDSELVRRAGMSIPEIFAAKGEEYFRASESDVLNKLGKKSGCIISTGGGCVLRAENYPSLHQNGTVFWLMRELDKLPTDGRPLSQSGDLRLMYENRKSYYESFADFVIDNNGSIENSVSQILEALG